MKLNRITAKICTGLLAAALLATPALAATGGGAMVRTSNTGLNLRAAASRDAEVLTEIPNGSFVLVEEGPDAWNWYKVVYNGTEGYVAGDYIAYAESLAGTYAYAASTAGTDVTLRAGPGTGYAWLKNLPEAGTALTVAGVTGEWLYVLDSTGTAGYIRSDLVNYKGSAAAAAAAVTEDAASAAAVEAPAEPAAEAAAETPAPTPVPSGSYAVTGSYGLADQVVATAKQYLGYRYTWGGMSPETGFDCSGFVNYVYLQHGIRMNRVAQDIYNNDGVAVSYSELQPGDLLFFGYGPYSVGHVGLYIGSNQMIHASTYTTGVIISDVSYSGNFVGAKRLIG